MGCAHKAKAWGGLSSSPRGDSDPNGLVSCKCASRGEKLFPTPEYTSKQPGDPVAACTRSSPELLQPLWLRPALSQNATTAPEGAILLLGSADFPCSLPVWDGPAAALEAFLLVHRLAAAVRGKLRHAGRSSSPGRKGLAAFLAAHCLTWGASHASTIYAEFDRQGLTADTVQNGAGPQSCSKYWSLSVTFFFAETSFRHNGCPQSGAGCGKWTAAGCAAASRGLAG